MENVGAYEAKTHLPKLLERVHEGRAHHHNKTWGSRRCPATSGPQQIV